MFIAVPLSTANKLHRSGIASSRIGRPVAGRKSMSPQLPAAPTELVSPKDGFCYKHGSTECSLRSLTCLQVQVLPRQWMVGPSSHSRPRLGETPAGASSAVNGRACRWRKLPAGTGQPPKPTCRPQHYEKTAVPKTMSSWEARGEGFLEQPNRVRSGEGSYGREISHQTNSVSQRDRGRSMHAQYDKEKKGR